MNNATSRLTTESLTTGFLTMGPRSRPAPIAAWLLVGCAAIGLAACGGGGGGTAANPGGGSGDGGGGGTGGGGGGGGGGGSGTSPLPEIPVVYVADQDQFEKYELYLADAAGAGGSVKVNDALPANGDVDAFVLTDDGSKVVYMADQDIVNRYELYLVNLEQPGVSVKLNAPLVPERDVRSFTVSADGSLVAYRADQDAEGMNELYLVSADNPGVSVKLNGPLAPDTDVLDGYMFSPDGSRIIYLADQDQKDLDQLYIVDIAMPGVSTRLNPDLVQDGNVTNVFAFSPDGNTVAYVADQLEDGVFELFSVDPAIPETASKLNGPLVQDGDVCRFRFSPDSTRVAYCADQDTDGVLELYTVELGAPGASQKLNPPLVQDGDVTSAYGFGPDSSFVVYTADQEVDDREELYRVDIAAPGAAVKLNAALVEGGNVFDFRIRPDGASVSYLADQDAEGVFELYEVALAEAGMPAKVSPPMSGSGVYGLDYATDGSRIVYSAAQDAVVAELYVVQPATPGVSTRLNDALAPNGEVWDFRVKH